MRVTTQMINASAAQAGLNIHTASLANYIQTSDSDDSIATLLESRLNTGSNTSSSYKKLAKSATALETAATALSSDSTDSILAKAESSGDKEEVCDTVKTLVDSYNSVLKSLKKSPSTLNNFYCSQLKSAASNNSTALKNAGVTIAKDGTISVDEDKLKSADISTIKKAFGESSDFSEKVSFVAEHIGANAQAGAASISSQYSANGILNSSYTDSQYDSKG